MNDEILIIRIDKETKEALKNRAFDLRLDGGMSELVKNLIDKELSQPPILSPSSPVTEQQ